jgi:hypothetical protein
VAIFATSVLDVTWTVVSEHVPNVVRHCPRCERARRFASSGRFRLNAQRRRLDVWLIYRCTACEATWNLPIFERIAPERLGTAMLRRLERNDPALAAAHASDLVLLRRAGVGVELDAPYRVERPPLPGGTLRVRFVVAAGCVVRLDRVLAGELGTSRAAVRALGIDRATLRRPVHTGQTVVLDVGACEPAEPTDCSKPGALWPATAGPCGRRDRAANEATSPASAVPPRR